MHIRARAAGITSKMHCWRPALSIPVPKTELARDAARELVTNYGFKRLSISDPFAAPVGSVLVYGTSQKRWAC